MVLVFLRVIQVVLLRQQVFIGDTAASFWFIVVSNLYSSKEPPHWQQPACSLRIYDTRGVYNLKSVK